MHDNTWYGKFKKKQPQIAFQSIHPNTSHWSLETGPPPRSQSRLRTTWLMSYPCVNLLSLTDLTWRWLSAGGNQKTHVQVSSIHKTNDSHHVVCYSSQNTINKTLKSLSECGLFRMKMVTSSANSILYLKRGNHCTSPKMQSNCFTNEAIRSNKNIAPPIGWSNIALMPQGNRVGWDAVKFSWQLSQERNKDSGFLTCQGGSFGCLPEFVWIYTKMLIYFGCFPKWCHLISYFQWETIYFGAPVVLISSFSVTLMNDVMQ